MRVSYSPTIRSQIDTLFQADPSEAPPEKQLDGPVHCVFSQAQSPFGLVEFRPASLVDIFDYGNPDIEELQVLMERAGY